MNKDAKKVTLKSGIPLDDDKLEMVSGGSGGRECPGNLGPGGQHEWGDSEFDDNGERHSVCIYCGVRYPG